MALIGINPGRPRERKISSLEKIATGLDIASKAVGLGFSIPTFIQTRKLNAAQLDASKTQQQQSKEKFPLEMKALESEIETGGMLKSLQTKNLSGDVAEDERRRKPLTIVQRDAYKDLLRQSGIDSVTDEMLPTTIGTMEDDRKSRLGAIQITPQAEREFKYKVQKEEITQDREKQARYIKPLDQYAETDSDAKEVKTALANKNAIERMVDQMIALREKHPNGTITDREDVARAQQLSTQALLKYKNLAQLGVLSKTDIELVDKLVPSNPLGVSGALVLGQDPIMAQLKQLRENLHGDFNVFIEARGLNGLPDPSNAPHGQKIKQDGKIYQWNGHKYVEGQ